MTLMARLAQLQLVQAERWQAEAGKFVNRHYAIETSRGSILDRNGRAMALDLPCYDLAIDYRAMNYDDLWITRQAIARLNALGIKGRRERLARLAELKAQIAQQIDEIPDAVSKAFGVPKEEILERFQDIRGRMDSLRQSQWSARRYNRATDAKEIAEGLVDPDMTPELREESAAHTILAAVPDHLMFMMDKVLDQYPGLRKVDAKRRVYPYGAVGAHIIGAMRPVNQKEYEAARFDQPDLLNDEPGNLHGYMPGDDIGEFGIERLAEDYLRGSRGVRLVEVGGDEIREKRQDPAPGTDLRTTIDIEMQRQLTVALLDPNRDLLKGNDGQNHNVAMVIMGVDGQVYAMITTPTYDLNRYRELYRELASDNVNMPLLNRAVSGAYPPGSTAKPLVAVAALTEGVVSAGEEVICQGHLYPSQPNLLRCTAVHGPVNVELALEESCNVYFYTMGKRLGLEKLVAWDRAFGLGSRTGIGLIEERRGSLINPARIQDPDIANHEAIQMGIGQGSMVVTPLQMACAYTALLRGEQIQPRLLLAGEMKTGMKLPISPNVRDTVRRGMEMVVSGSAGTARSALRLRIPVAGKTGTATAPRAVVQADGTTRMDEGVHAWFVGYVPADRPQFVIAAIKEYGGHGGVQAAPLMREAVLALERNGYLPPEDVRR